MGRWPRWLTQIWRCKGQIANYDRVSKRGARMRQPESLLNIALNRRKVLVTLCASLTAADLAWADDQARVPALDWVR